MSSRPTSAAVTSCGTCHTAAHIIRGKRIPTPPDANLAHFHENMVELWIVLESQLDFLILVVRLDPVSNPLLKVNKALLSRLVKIFRSLRCHASDTRISYANPNDFRNHLVRLGLLPIVLALDPP